MPAEENERLRATEQTPLLGEADPAALDRAEEAPLAEEASFKELIVILGSIWLGVFLAALGMWCSPSFEFHSNQRRCRFNHCSDIIRTHLVIFQLLLAAFLAGNLLPHFQCGIPASERPADRYILSAMGSGLLQCLLRRGQSNLWPGQNPMGYHPRPSCSRRRWRRSHGHLDVRDVGFGSSAQERHLAGHWKHLLWRWDGSRRCLWWLDQ